MSIKVTEELQYTLGDLGGLYACPGKTWRDPNISNITDLEDLHSKKWDLRQSCKLLEYYRHAHTQIHTQSLLANSERFLRNSLPNHLLITNLSRHLSGHRKQRKLTYIITSTGHQTSSKNNHKQNNNKHWGEGAMESSLHRWHLRCAAVNKKLWDRQRIRKLCPIQRKNKSIGTVLEDMQTLDLPDKDFKSAIMSMLKKKKKN